MTTPMTSREALLAVIDKHLNGHAGPQYRAACENIRREVERLPDIAQGYNATQRELEILELRKLASHWKERHDEVLQKHIECCGVAQTCGWQPIETAPRDGTRLLGTGGGLADTVEVISYNERVAAWNTENYTLDDRDDEADGYNRPSRWMPIPKPSPVPSTKRGCGDPACGDPHCTYGQDGRASSTLRAVPATERCPTCNDTDIQYRQEPPFRRCNDPWHGDDHLRAKATVVSSKMHSGGGE